MLDTRALRNILFIRSLFVVLLCFCVNSWGECVRRSVPYTSSECQTCGGSVTSVSLCGGSCGVASCGNGTTNSSCNVVDYEWPEGCTCSGNGCPNCYLYFVIESGDCQSELQDTLLFACSESIVNGQAVATIYKLFCKAANGEITECNGKQNVDISTDGKPVKQMQGTCSQNGLPVGPFGGATPQDSTELPNGANADCFAITGSKCHMKDKLSGNTFTCDCDGSCQVAIQNLMAGNASCTNPYPQPTSSSDSLNLNSSPSSSGSGEGSSPSSSGSGEGSSPSSSGSGEGGTSEDFEYDYNVVLQSIRANTQYTGQGVNNLNYKVDGANEYLRQIANKDWNPTINVSPPSVTLNADTSKSPFEILGLLKEGGFNSGDTAGFEGQIDGIMGKLDSIVGEGVPDMSDSLGIAVRGIHTSFNAFKDSLGNSSFNDSLNRWNGLLTNNGVITGNGSNSCPSILTQQFTWSFPLGGSSVNIQVGTLGKYICTPISPFNVTIWQFCRVILRAMVSIGCMIWLYKAVLGIEGGSNEED